MKLFAAQLFVALSVLCCVPSAHAQFVDVTGGSAAIHISTDLTAFTNPRNVAVGAYTPAPYDNQIPFLGALAGVFNSATGAGSVALMGQFTASGGGNVLLADTLAIETVDTVGIVTANVYLNGHFIFHGAIFTITIANPLRAPFSGTFLYVTTIPMTMSPALTKTMAQVFAVTVPPQTISAYLSVNLGLVKV
jgi:hypothetical protein